jgi:glycosyltransferase involved in cell wall biosynthesis
MSPRRVLLVQADLRFCGSTERLRCGVRALVEAGWEVHVLAGPGARSDEVAAAGATVHRQTPNTSGWRRPFTVARARRLVDSLEVLLTVVVGEPLAPLAAHLRRPHLLELARPPQARLPWSRAHLRAVIVPCRTMIEAVVNRGGLPRDRLSILAHGPEPAGGARPAFTGGGPARVGVAGGLEQGLGAANLLEAGRALIDGGRDLSLVILGEGPAEEGLRRRARELGIIEQVTVTAPAAPTTGELLCELDVYVCPQPKGAPGWLTAEALSLGRPALLAANQGSFELVRDGVDGYLVDRTDSAELARGIAALLDDPAAARTVGERARSRWRRDRAPYGARLVELLEQASDQQSPEQQRQAGGH